MTVTPTILTAIWTLKEGSILRRTWTMKQIVESCQTTRNTLKQIMKLGLKMELLMIQIITLNQTVESSQTTTSTTLKQTMKSGWKTKVCMMKTTTVWPTKMPMTHSIAPALLWYKR
uniref:Uncharacterized protein n=1 Tax=Cacopsylla melanoneura TaxID=428564 RepID=A0A8D8Z3A4_9HEMI